MFSFLDDRRLWSTRQQLLCHAPAIPAKSELGMEKLEAGRCSLVSKLLREFPHTVRDFPQPL